MANRGPAPDPGRATSRGGHAGETGERRIEVRVIPRAKRDEVGGERAGRLVVRTTAAPVDGKANAAVVRLIAQHLGVPTRSVEVVAGDRSRDKTLRIAPTR